MNAVETIIILFLLQLLWLYDTLCHFYTVFIILVKQYGLLGKKKLLSFKLWDCICLQFPEKYGNKSLQFL